MGADIEVYVGDRTFWVHSNIVKRYSLWFRDNLPPESGVRRPRTWLQYLMVTTYRMEEPPRCVSRASPMPLGIAFGICTLSVSRSHEWSDGGRLNGD